jgi:hypothetical protein
MGNGVTRWLLQGACNGLHVVVLMNDVGGWTIAMRMTDLNLLGGR